MVRSFAITGFVLSILALSLTACSNTFDGFGRDMESAGKKVQETF
jgi:predicted small secreted protein